MDERAQMEQQLADEWARNPTDATAARIEAIARQYGVRPPWGQQTNAGGAPAQPQQNQYQMRRPYQEANPLLDLYPQQRR
jgi:hypothetical protein